MSKWYVAIGDRILGPWDEQEVVNQLGSSEIAHCNFAWKEGLGDWVKLMEQEEFQSGMPQKPSPERLDELRKSIEQSKPKPPPPPTTREWFVFLNEVQEGPFDIAEIKELINGGGIGSESFVWKVGMEDWVCFAKSELAYLQKKSLPVNIPPMPASVKNPDAVVAPPKEDSGVLESSLSDRRKSPRKPVVARVLFHDNQLLGKGMCRDLSIGGAQVMIDSGSEVSENFEVKPGSVISMNVHCGSEKEAFTADAVVVRELKGQRGFAVRFQNLSDDSYQTINDILKD